ncbi:MAG: alpha-amylase family glycosyl hydrolase [Treponema sp.]|nr:alpha-amylase family glycosyl hydrolase [Treponema sp.]
MANQPEWLKTAIFYQIYPQSFYDTNGDGTGDINGIICKLDYIKELGCNAIWLNPCFESPFGDAGYDVSDYYKVATRYGSNFDLERLFEEAHKRNMHVLLDLVPGHTSVEHPWFLESMKAGKNEFTDRYIWTDSIWEEVPSLGNLRGISDRDGSCGVNFFSHQPALNYGFYKITRPWQQSPDEPGPTATLEEMKNVMRFWLKKGCDGFRVDMAGSLVKQDVDGKGTIELWQKVRPFLDEEFPESALISEWGEPDKSLQAGFHMDFLLHFGPSHYNDLFRCSEPYFSSRGKGSINAFIEKYLENYEKSEQKGLICIPSGNHDMDRLARTLSQEEMKIAFAFLLSMPGAPFIYYGDEIGMRYIEGLTSVEGGYGRTGSRSPMQWDNTQNMGFSSAEKSKLYIPTDTSLDSPNVEAQKNNPYSLWHEVKRVIETRLSNPALQNCSAIEFIPSRNEYPLVYKRSCSEQTIFVIINPSAQECDVSLPVTQNNCSGKIIYSTGGQISQSQNQECLVYHITGGTAAFIELINN